MPVINGSHARLNVVQNLRHHQARSAGPGHVTSGGTTQVMRGEVRDRQNLVALLVFGLECRPDSMGQGVDVNCLLPSR